MRTAEYISPNCCERSTKTKVVRLGYYPKGIEYGKYKHIKPKWWIAGDEIYGDKHFNIKIEIEKCPFCDKKLPNVEINKCMENVFDGDTDYCDTCDERIFVCDCYPPEYRWKVSTKYQRKRKLKN